MLKLQILTLQQTVDQALLAEFANDDDDDEAFSSTEFFTLMVGNLQQVQNMIVFYLYTQEKLRNILADRYLHERVSYRRLASHRPGNMRWMFETMDDRWFLSKV